MSLFSARDFTPPHESPQTYLHTSLVGERCCGNPNISQSCTHWDPLPQAVLCTFQPVSYLVHQSDSDLVCLSRFHSAVSCSCCLFCAVAHGSAPRALHRF